jgi:hypothetical protein
MDKGRPISPLTGLALMILSCVLTFAGAVVNHALIAHLGKVTAPQEQHRPSPVEDRVPVNV